MVISTNKEASIILVVGDNTHLNGRHHEGERVIDKGNEKEADKATIILILVTGRMIHEEHQEKETPIIISIKILNTINTRMSTA